MQRLCSCKLLSLVSAAIIRPLNKTSQSVIDQLIVSEINIFQAEIRIKGLYDLKLRIVFLLVLSSKSRACERNHRKHNGFIGVNVEWTNSEWIIGIIFATYYYIEVFIMLRRTCSPNVSISSEIAPSSPPCPSATSRHVLRMERHSSFGNIEQQHASLKYAPPDDDLPWQQNLSPGFSQGINICIYIWFTTQKLQVNILFYQIRITGPIIC